MRLINEILCNRKFFVDRESIGALVRDLINMNWWNTSGYLRGYYKNRRVNSQFTNEQKLIALQLKEFYRVRTIATKDDAKFKQELDAYIKGDISILRQLSAFSMTTRANPSQYFTLSNGEMTWVDCTSRATYAAKYVFQNGYIDFDNKCRVLGANKIIEAIADGSCQDLGVTNLFIDGDNGVKAEIFSQKLVQKTVEEWVRHLGLEILPDRVWLFDLIKHVRTDPFKVYEETQVSLGFATGINEALYGFSTCAQLKKLETSNASVARHASHASTASTASTASSVSRASLASNASAASAASNASDASRASVASAASTASSVSRASYASNASAASAVSTTSDASYASHVSRASRVSGASHASDASTASNTSRASDANCVSNVSRVSAASGACYASTASTASNLSSASDVSCTSNLGRASNASAASDAGTTNFTGNKWAECVHAVQKPAGLNYPSVFRKGIFAIAGSWKINKDIMALAKVGVIDPFSGHGTSPLYAKRNHINYLGFETNAKAFMEYLNAVNDSCKGPGSIVSVECRDSTEFVPELVGKFDVCYTSPPYFNFEEYGGNTAHFDNCETYEQFHEKITVPVFSNVFRYLIQGGTLALQVEKNASSVLAWKKVITSVGFVILSSGVTGGEANKYSTFSRRDQSLLIFKKP